MTDREMLVSLGFRLETSVEHLDPEDPPFIYFKTVQVCNSNCIGCEYTVFMDISKVLDMYSVMLCIYKPLMHDEDSLKIIHRANTDMPCNRITVTVNERRDFADILSDCVMTVAKMMVAMDFRQVSGTDFFDLSDSDRCTMLEDAKREIHRITEWTRKVGL